MSLTGFAWRVHQWRFRAARANMASFNISGKEAWDDRRAILPSPPHERVQSIEARLGNQALWQAPSSAFVKRRNGT
jgi:hypothetical protein